MLTLPGPVVSVDWLRAHLDDPGLRVADVRWSLAGPPGRDLYEAGHLPGAVFLDVDRDLSSPGDGPGRHPLPGRDKLARVLGAAGIGDEHVVVAYDAAGGSVASRLWWLFRHHGRDGACAILDGGLPAWTDAGLPLSREPAVHPAATWTPGEERNDVASVTEVLDAIHDGGVVVLDARAPERYRGEVEPVDPRAGHIPGARSAPTAGNLGPDGRLLSPDALRARYAALGVDDETDVVAYCGSGINATHALLSLALAGRDGRLYEGSWSDWSSDPNRPIATADEP